MNTDGRNTDILKSGRIKESFIKIKKALENSKSIIKRHREIYEGTNR